MADAPSDAFLRFCKEGNDESPGESWDPHLCGESVDKMCPGDPANPDPENGGWFPIANYQFSLSGTSAGRAGGPGPPSSTKGQVGGTKPAGSGGPAQQSGHGDDGIFKGVTVTMPLQYGSVFIMEACTKFALAKHPDDVPKIEMAYIYVRRPGYAGQWAAAGSGQDWFMAIYIYGVTITDYSTSISCEDTFTLNYEKMSISYYGTDPVTNLLSQKLRINREWSNSGNSEQDDST